MQAVTVSEHWDSKSFKFLTAYVRNLQRKQERPCLDTTNKRKQHPPPKANRSCLVLHGAHNATRYPNRPTYSRPRKPKRLCHRNESVPRSGAPQQAAGARAPADRGVPQDADGPLDEARNPVEDPVVLHVEYVLAAHLPRAATCSEREGPEGGGRGGGTGRGVETR